MLVCAVTIFSITSCKKDDDLPEIPQPVVNEPEQITTVELHITNTSDNTEVHAHWSDPDGPGGDDPMVDDIVLQSGVTYTVEVEFLDESGDETEDITAEILEEDDEHLLCFEPEGDVANALTVTRTDSDGTYEVGLESTWEATAAATGEIKVTLKHQPGVKDGTCDPGDTDVEVHFEITINE